jgi:hypothetical protein
MLSAINPSAQIAKAKDTTLRNDAMELVNATERYYARNNAYPWGNVVGYKTADVGAESWINNMVNGGDLKSTFVDKIRGVEKFSLDQGAAGVEVCFESVVQKKEVCVPSIIN